jgi:hypothetical protein
MTRLFSSGLTGLLMTNLYFLISTRGKRGFANTLQANLCHDIMKWKELLEAIRGKLELSYSFYYILSLKFDKESHSSPMTIQDERIECNQITINDTNDSEAVLINQKERS